MWYMSKFWYLPRISGDEKALCGVRTCMVGLKDGSGHGALNRDPLGVFSAWPHPQGHTAFALLSVGFLTKNYQVVKKPTNKSATCSKSKGANYLLQLSRFKWKPLKRKKAATCVQNPVPNRISWYGLRSPRAKSQTEQVPHSLLGSLKSRTMRELSTYLETPSEG